jgi:hypothetical protein
MRSSKARTEHVTGISKPVITIKIGIALHEKVNRATTEMPDLHTAEIPES